MRRSPVYEAAQSLIDEVAEAARKVAAWSPEKRERVRLEGGAMSASAYLAKVEADPRRAAALQRARDRARGVRAAASAEQWPRDLSEAEMDELATALNEHDAGSIGFHGLVDRVLDIVRRTAGVPEGGKS